MQPIKKSIKRQLEVNESKNLLFVNAEQIIDIEPDFLAALEELLDSISGDKGQNATAEIVSFAAQALLKRLYSVNQYLKIGDQSVAELEEIYLQTWRTMIRTGNIQTTLREEHYPELSRWLASLYPEEFRERLRSSPEVGHVVYEQYSAELQIELLQIDVPHLRQPLIDIGCGSQANLVRYLRFLGVEAHGFDRHLETDEPYLEQTNWFEYRFKPTSWGTIISNMAFTNHLNYAYLHDPSQLEPYLLKMRDIMESLAIGGQFHYAPSLPFVEDRIAPERYRVERKRTVGDILVSLVTKIG